MTLWSLKALLELYQKEGALRILEGGFKIIVCNEFS